MPEPLDPNESAFQEFDRTASAYDTMETGRESPSRGPRTVTRAGERREPAVPDLAAGRHYRPAHRRDPDRVVNSGIAWFSVALGVTQLIAPDALARLIGVRPTRNTRTTMRVIGMRELTTGLGLLSNARSSPWLWTRLAGDVVDLSLLGTGVGRRADDRVRATRAAMAVGGVAALDWYAASRSQRLQRERLAADRFASPHETIDGPLPYDTPMRGGAGAAVSADETTVAVTTPDADAARRAGRRKVRHAVTVNRPAQDLYAYWRDFGNLPHFMRHLEEVRSLEGGRSHWVTRGPGGARVEWDAEIVADVPGELIAWQSLPGADVKNAGAVRFIPVPAGRGTEVHVEMDYSPPAGALGTVVARLFRSDPGQQVRDDLKAFKSVMEAGEVLYAGAKDKEKAEAKAEGASADLTSPDAELAEVRG